MTQRFAHLKAATDLRGGLVIPTRSLVERLSADTSVREKRTHTPTLMRQPDAFPLRREFA